VREAQHVTIEGAVATLGLLMARSTVRSAVASPLGHLVWHRQIPHRVWRYPHRLGEARGTKGAHVG